MALDLSLLEMVALLETPTGFAFFNVCDKLCNRPEVMFLLEFIKFDDKSVAWHSDGPGLKLTYAIRKYCGRKRPLIVGDVKLRAVIKSNVNVNCYENEVVIRELMWGLRNVLHDYVYQERGNITLEYLRPLCQGFKDCIRRYGINIPTEAIDRNFIAWASAMHRCDLLIKHYRKTLREICDPLVPDIGGIVKDDILYAEVMAKILTPRLAREWNPFKCFPEDVVEKIKAIDALAGAARKKVDRELYGHIYFLARDVRKFLGSRRFVLQKLESLADQIGREKRSHAEVVEGTSGQDGDCASNANGVCAKKARLCF